MIWSRKKLERVHSSLSTKYTWYNAWHKKKFHGKFHAGVLAVFILTAFAFSLYALNNDFFSKAAASYYVSPTGLDTNPGTQAAPWRTIKKAADTVGAGATVYVAPGNYEERVNLYTSGTSAAPITFKGNGGTPKVSYGFYVTGSYVNVSGFEVSPGRRSTDTGYGALTAKTGSNITFENMYVHDLTQNTQQGAYVRDASRVTLNNIRFININSGAIEMIYLGGNTMKNCTVDYTKTTVPSVGKVVNPWSGAVIENNDFRFSYGNTIHSSSLVNGLTIRGNKFWKTARPTTDDNHVQTIGFYETATNVVIEGNTFAGKPGVWAGPGGTWASQFTHIFFGDSALPVGVHSNVTVKNNVFLEFDGAYWFKVHSDNGKINGLKVYNNYIRNGVLAEGAGVTNDVYKNNIVQGGLANQGVKDFNMHSGAVPTGSGSGSFVGTAKFVNGTITEANRWGLDADWRLASDSPGINRGITRTADTNVPATDKNCYTRDSQPDVGPYELNSVPSCGGTTPPPTDPTNPPTDPTNPPSNTTGVYYVAPSGLDTNSGTQAAPFKTVEKASNVVKAGEKIVIRGGTYNERPTFTTSGTSASRITVEPFGTEQVTISKGFVVDGSYNSFKNLTVNPGDTVAATGQILVNGSYNSLDGMSYVDANWVGSTDWALTLYGSNNTVTNINFRNSGIHVVGRGAQRAAGTAENNLIKGGTINYTRNISMLIEADKTTVENIDMQYPGRKNIGDVADGIQFNANNFTLRGSIIRNVFQTQPLTGTNAQHPDAIEWWFDGNDFLMENNIIGSAATSTYNGTPIWDQGHMMWSSRTAGRTSHRVIIRNNIFIQTEGTYALNGSSIANGDRTGQMDGWKIVGNNFVTGKNPQTGANGNMIWGQSLGAMANWTITNNYFGGRGVDITSIPTGCVLDYNAHLNYAPLAASTNSIRVTDPLFVNAGLLAATEYGVKADYHLKTGSPLVGEGVASNYLPKDKDSQTRANPPTIGAYEGTVVVPIDITGPTIDYVRPTAGSIVAGSAVDNSARVEDNSGVAKVEFFAEGISMHTQLTPGSDGNYGYPWDSTKFQNGLRKLKVVATDKVGNSSSKEITVDVQNIIADTTPPAPKIISPAPNAIVSGTVTITATATDNVKVASIAFYADDIFQVLDATPDAAGNFVQDWPSIRVTDGEHVLKVRALDTSGNEAYDYVTVNVKNNVPVQDTTPPTVAFNRPSEGSTVSGIVDVSVNAQDVGGTVTKVEIWVDGVLDMVAPKGTDGFYGNGLDSTKYSNAGHTITAKAYDTANNVGQASRIVTIFNDLTAPEVTYVRPGNGATVSGASVDNSVQATDIGGTGVAKVEFFADGLKTHEQTTPGSDGNYGYAWDSTKFTNANHVLKAVATDKAGNSKIASITITVKNPIAPTVNITAPLNNATVSGVITVTTSATDDVEVRQVEFTIDGVWKTYDTDAPFTYAWDTTKYANGSHTILAKAADMEWNYGVSQIVNVNINNIAADDISPVIKITSPTNGAAFTRSTVISATASDNVGVTRVEFYAGNTYLGSDTSSPYSMGWAPKGWPYGTYTVTAKAFDKAGNMGTSSVTVNYAKRWWQIR